MALATNSTPGEIVLNGDLHGSGNALQPELTPTGVAAGTYNFPHVVVDQKGRVLSIEEAGTGDVPCATDSSCGLVKIGSTLEIDAGSPDLAIINIPISSAGSPGSLGMVKIGDSITVNSGLISIDEVIATAGSPLTLGVIKVGANLGIDSNGVLSRGGEGDATVSAKGIVQIGDNIDVTVGSPSGIISLSSGTNTTLGIVNSADSDNIDIGTGSPALGELDVGPNIALKSVFQSFTAAQNSAMQTLTNISGTINLDASLYKVFNITTNGDTTINSITNWSANEQIDIIIHLGDLISEDALTLNSSFFKISGNTQSGHSTLITCTQIIDGGDQAYTLVQPYMV